jgi:pimeloyl-ACP methyl ester carboxylesterase
MRSLFLPDWQTFLRYEDLPGKDPARVYLPGLGGAAAATYLQTVADPVLAGHRSLLVDFLGSGFSDRPENFKHSLDEHARSVAMLLDHLGLKDCVVVGHSMGGSVAITLADVRSELVSRLVVAEANLDPGGGSFSRQVVAQSEEAFVKEGFPAILQGLREAAQGGDTTAAALAGIFQIAAPHAVYRQAVALVYGISPTMRMRFYELPIPRVYVYGEHSLPEDEDSATPDTPDPNQLMKHGIRVLVVPGAGHSMMFDNPTGFVHVLKDAIGG